MIDLHLHSTHSDGAETPSALVRRGARAGLSAMALTDHDTMDGSEEFPQACREAGMTGIVGIELSCDTEENDGALHILGYGMNPEDPEVDESLTRVRESRNWRNEQILEKLNGLGLELEWSEVQACAGEDVIGRVHFAQALINRDYVFTVEEAFEKYLSKDAPAYVDRYGLYPEEGIRMITRAGGAAVLAHPFSWLDDEAELERSLIRFKRAGLYGIEVFHSAHTPEMSVTLMRLANRLGLKMTGGSDYHGEPREERASFRALGALAVPDHFLPPLLDAIDGARNPQVFLGEKHD